MKATAAKKTEALVATIDQATVLKLVKECEREVDEIAEKAGEVSVQDDDDYRVAAALLIELVTKRKFFEAEREGFMVDVKKLVDRVNAWFGPALEKAEETEGRFRRALVEYALSVESKAYGLRKAAAHLPARDEERASEMLREANECLPPKVGGIAITTKAAVEILDEKKLPEWAWRRVVDVKAIEAAFARGEAVPGAKALVNKSVRVTPKNAKGGEA